MRNCSNILQLPFRRSHAVSLSDAITQYISSKYDQRPDMFAEDLMILDRLRSEAINVQEPHVSGVSRLVTYAAQLKWLGGKFPVDVSGGTPVHVKLDCHADEWCSQGWR